MLVRGLTLLDAHQLEEVLLRCCNARLLAPLASLLRGGTRDVRLEVEVLLRGVWVEVLGAVEVGGVAGRRVGGAGLSNARSESLARASVSRRSRAATRSASAAATAAGEAAAAPAVAGGGAVRLGLMPFVPSGLGCCTPDEGTAPRAAPPAAAPAAAAGVEGAADGNEGMVAAVNRGEVGCTATGSEMHAAAVTAPVPKLSLKGEEVHGIGRGLDGCPSVLAPGSWGNWRGVPADAGKGFRGVVLFAAKRCGRC